MVVLRCEESIDVQPLYLVSAELDVFDELQMVGYGKSFGFEKRWIQLKNTNLLKKPNKNMILDTIDSAAMDYEGFSGSLIADYNNCIVGIANMQNVEKGKANSLLGISVKNRKKFFENNNIPVYDRAALLNVRCEETKAKAFQNGIDQNVYLKNKQLENDTNSRNIEENTNPLLNMSNVYSEDYNWNIKYTRIEGLLGNSNKRRKERKELTKQWAKEFEQYPGWLIVPADFRQQVKSYTNGKELLQCSEKELESNLDYCNELLDFAYEYTRRYKKSCLPLDKNIENNLYKIWDTLNSHSDLKEKNKNKWFTVGLYLLENYRQNMDVVQSHVREKSIEKIRKELKKLIYAIEYPPNKAHCIYTEVSRYNSFVLGVHAYYSMATKVSADFRPIAFSVQKSLKARLRQRIKTAKEVRKNKKPIHITNVIRDKYGKSDQMRYVNDLALAPIGYVRHSHPIQKAYGANSYTKNGRELVHKKLEGIDMAVLHDLMRNPIEGESIEFNDNRLSLYSAQKGKCAVTGNQMDADDVVCIRKTPKEQGGTDKYSNLLLVCRNIQKLLYIKNPDTFIAEMEKLNLDLKRTEKLLKLRSLTFVESC